MSNEELSSEVKFLIYALTKNLSDEELQLFINEVCNIRSVRSNKKIFRKIVWGK